MVGSTSLHNELMKLMRGLGQVRCLAREDAEEEVVGDGPVQKGRHLLHVEDPEVRGLSGVYGRFVRAPLNKGVIRSGRPEMRALSENTLGL